ncbi:MAG: lamin tail domain-containing protein, partial [Pyrinomonadaceae bacterium]
MSLIMYYSAAIAFTLLASAVTTAQVPPTVGQIVISEFRTRGPGGVADEFVEVQNVSNVVLDISGCRLLDSSSGGTVINRLVINSGTLLQPGQHFLMVLPTSYSLTAYPAGVGTTATSDQDYAVGFADDGGLAFTLNDNTVLDQVGMSAGSAFGEGTRLTPQSAAAAGVNASYVRRMSTGLPQDTNSNGADFVLVSTD